MYESYFGLTERPFSIAPDPDYLYMSSRHKEAMAHLSYGLSQGGCFIVLTGEVGTGKTTLCRNLLTDLPNNVDVALILNANLGSTELLQTVCDELKIAYKDEASQKKLLDLINGHLLQTFSENRHTVLIIDEAQLLKRNVLEQIRLLTNLETTKSKLLQIILIGQPELYDLLSRNDLRQLAQRVTARYHLGALQLSEIEEYVNCRLSVAGCKQPLFSRQALNKMHALTDGIPRKINVLADQALLATYSQNKSLVDAKTVAKTAKEVFIATKSASQNKSSRVRSSITPRHWLAFAGVLLGLNAALWWYMSSGEPSADEHSNIKLNERVDGQSVVQPVELIDTKSREVNASAQFDSAQEKVFTPGSVVVSESYLSADDNSVVLDDASAALLVDSPVVAPGYQSVAIDEAVATLDSPVVSLNESVVTLGGFDEATPLGRVLDVSADVTGRIAVLRRLAVQWGVELPRKLIRSVCDSVQDQELRCLNVNSVSHLNIYNRPAVVLLKHKGYRHRVIVKSIDQGIVTVLVGSSAYKVSMAEIEQRWDGNGLAFWRPSLSETPFLKQGDVGSAITAVRLQLNAALANAELGSLLELNSPVFDQAMAEKVTLLQTTFALLGDGLIGNETYLFMNELVYPDTTPVLRQRSQSEIN